MQSKNPSKLRDRRSSSGSSASAGARVKKGRRGTWFPFAVIGWFGRILGTVLAVPLDLLLLGACLGVVVLYIIQPELPDVESLREVKFEEPLRVYTADGSLMAQFGVKRRTAVAYEDIPPELINAFIATEDSRFFDHYGIDVVGLARAAMSVVKTGAPSQGGSTITMQVARNFFLTREKTAQRKIAEVLLALRVENLLSKEEILELYLNKIFFGHRAYGISAAAETYYGKSLNELLLPEMAMLAGLPKGPSLNNPLTNPERALARRNYILGRMFELGYIDAGRYETAVAWPLTAQAHDQQIEFNAGYVAEMVRQEMIARYGDKVYSRGLKVTTTVEEDAQRAAQEAVRKSLREYSYRHGYHGAEAKIDDVAIMSEAELDEAMAAIPAVAALKPGIVVRADKRSADVYLGNGQWMQLERWQVRWARRFMNVNWRGPVPKRVTDAVAVGDVIRLRQNDKGQWVLFQVPKVGGALVALDPADGAIRALVGGYDFAWSNFNRATDARRQPGSTFKPFVYAAAFDKGWTPASLVNDTAVKERISRTEMWEPKNADRKTMGPIRIRVALTKSRNLAVVNLLKSMGINEARDYIERFGFEPGELPYGLSLALGTAAISPLRLAEAYAVFANGGYHVPPYFISRIEDSEGNLLSQVDPPRACEHCWYVYPEEPAETVALNRASSQEAERVVDPRIVYNIDSILKDVIRAGTGQRAKKLGRSDIAGKTGTTNETRDSWFAGYQKDVVTVAWMGFDDWVPLGRGESGGRAALGMWNQFMKKDLKDRPEAMLEVPEGMVSVRVSASSGRPTKSRSGSVQEYVRVEVQDNLQGPEEHRVAAKPVKRKGKKRKKKRSAPRVVDQLF